MQLHGQRSVGGSYVKHKISDAEGLSIAASENTNVKIIKELLKSKNISDSEKLDALWDSLDNSNPEVCKVLLKVTGGANSSLTESGKTILMEACTKGRADIVNILRKNGADVTARDKRGNCALGYALESENADKDLISALVKAGAYRNPELKMMLIPGKNMEMLSTEVTQEIYTALKLNPSEFVGENLPVDSVSWYDAIDFCNDLSLVKGLTPVYIIDGKKVTKNDSADGFRLPTEEEWEYAAKGGENYRYSGSNDIDEVAWYSDNSGGKTHPVAQKKPNRYGLYDMCGNVYEWCWNVVTPGYSHRICGGNYSNYPRWCEVSKTDYGADNGKNYFAGRAGSVLGFRVVRTIK